ncbi:PREDICTED: uncharacterized protein LOC107069056 [Polistes dominula]|uniref:Uncharacterized protein LOC107069056 n=1 Tax=Polistes dominula TaxID=743375 RepID=A0ABM1IMQ0_POLDO|nr:PREDICTED: uncharacterized protein LOC107069056 [Polistes dominula]
MLPEITMQEFIPRESTFLTPRKRQSTEETHIETPIKRKYLRFEDITVPSNAEIAMIPETEEIPVPTADYSIESSPNLESINVDLQQVKRKFKKKRMFADKITKLSHKVIRKCINNVNAHTVSLKVIDVNITTSEILFQEAPARFISTRKNKWNSPLNKLFNMDIILSSTEKELHMESEHSLEKSTEFLRLMDKSNKTEELPSDLSSAIGRSIEISKNISSEKSIAISINELPKVIKFHDAIELSNSEPEKFQSPEITEKLFIPDARFIIISILLLNETRIISIIGNNLAEQ